MNRVCLSSRRGYSIFELIAVVAILGVVAAILLGFAEITENGISESKLESDVRVINQAAQVYLANGGSFDSISTDQEVLDKMKTQNASSTAMGLKSSFVDARLKIGATISTDGGPRAVWNASDNKFEIKETGVGVTAFVLDDNAGLSSYGEEFRESSTNYSDGNGWIWDYSDGTSPGKSSPTVIALNGNGNGSGGSSGGSGSGEGSGSGGGGGDDAETLSAPLFSINGGNHPLADFNLTLSLLNPNPSGSSEIYYRIGRTGSYSLYGGWEIDVTLDDMVYAYARSNDSSLYTDSDPAGEYYEGVPVTLSLALSTTQSSFDYYDFLDSEHYATVSLANQSDLPSFLITDSVFQVYWTADGSSPTTSNTRSVADPFSGSFPNQQISITKDSWDEDDSYVIQAFADADHSYVNDSTVQSVTLTREVLDLPVPSISAEGTDEEGEYIVTIAFSEEVPEGTEIYYTADGSTPTFDSSTRQVSAGSVYGGPFRFLLESTTMESSSEESSEPSGAGSTISIGAGSGDVPISSVTLSSGGADVVQNESYDRGSAEVVDSSNSPIELQSITLDDEDGEIVADHLNVLEVNVSNLNFPDGLSGVSTARDGETTSSVGDDDFSDEIEAVLSSTDLRAYMDYSSGTKSVLENIDYDFDMTFAPMYNSDYLVYMERYGNSTFELQPLNSDGEVISGANTLRFESYSWNTGYAPSEQSGQPFYIGVVDIAQFGVDTDETPITGFRVNNDYGADFKFWVISDETFEGRTIEYESATIRAIAIPPAGLESWFQASNAGSLNMEGFTSSEGGSSGDGNSGSNGNGNGNGNGSVNNNGHGNNEDGVDSSNPSQGNGGPNGGVDESEGVDDESGSNGNGNGNGNGNN